MSVKLLTHLAIKDQGSIIKGVYTEKQTKSNRCAEAELQSKKQIVASPRGGQPIPTGLQTRVIRFKLLVLSSLAIA